MDKIFQSLQELEGVNGVLITDASGNVLAFNAHSMYDAAILQQVSRSVVNALDSVKLVQEEWEAVTAQFTEGRLLLRNLSAGVRGKAQQLTLCVIADARLNPSFASVAIRVAVGKLRSLIESGQPLSGLSGNVKGGPSGAQSSAQLAATQSAALPAEVASSGLSWSGLGNASSMSASGVAVADAESAAVLTNCTKALAKSVGPIAKIFVKDAVRQAFPDRPFSKDQTKRLLSELVKHIDNPNDAALFQRTVLSAIAS